MSKRVFGVATFTPTATADATNLANATYMALSANVATARLTVTEIYLGGQATASAVSITQFARGKIIAVTPGALAAPNSDGYMDTGGLAVTSGAVAFVSAGTAPQRADLTTAPRLHLNYNAFGGVVRWVAEPTQGWGITGVTANVSESNLSAYTGSSASATLGAHIVYESM